MLEALLRDADRWLDLFQTIGIVGAFLVTAYAANREAESREDDHLFTLAGHHQALWEASSSRPELQRVLRDDVDPAIEPPTLPEREFLNVKIVHFMSAWRKARRGGIISEKELAADIRKFPSHPLPRAVWNETRDGRNPKFVAFVERAIEQRGRLSNAGD